MLTTPMDILEQFPIRKSKAQKQAFRDAVKVYSEGMGYSCTEEKGSLGVRNLVIGDPKSAKYLVTAHYDTCARLLWPNMVAPCNALVFWAYQLFQLLILLLATVLIGVIFCLVTGRETISSTAAMIIYWLLLLTMLIGPANITNANDNTSGVVTLLEIARTLPESQRSKACFVLFDLEEAGLLGSYAYRKAHKQETNNQVILNLDCVGDGDHILLMPTKKLKKNVPMLTPVYKACGYFGKKSILVKDKGFCVYPSDQANFPYGIGIGAFSIKKGIGHYYSRIHTPKDTILDQTNVNILRAAITSLICGTAAQ